MRGRNDWGQLGLGWNYLPLAEGELRDGPTNEDENTVSVLFPTLYLFLVKQACPPYAR